MRLRKYAINSALFVLTFLLSLELFLRVSAGILLALQKQPLNRNENTIRILAIGESTTQGSGGIDPDRNYPNILQKILNEKCNPNIEVINLGVAGTNTRIILESLPAQISQFAPRLIITMMGINDDTLAAPSTDKPTPNAETIELSRPKPLKLFKLFLWAKLELKNRRLKAEQRVKPSQIIDEMIAGRTLNDKNFALLVTQPLTNLGDHEYSKQIHMKALRAFPEHPWALLGLANLYRTEMNYRESIRLHNLALNSVIDPGEKNWFLYELAVDYALDARWKDFNGILENLETTPNNIHLFADLMISHSRIADARRLLIKAAKRYPHDAKIQGLLLSTKNSRSPRSTPPDLPIFESIPASISNYRAISKLTRDANINLIVMQYPNRPIELIRQMIPILQGDKIWLLENKAGFEKSLNISNYSTFFYDRFGGTFGHLTKAGNEVIASNISRLILSQSELSRSLRCRN